jgi:hypothetical protein
MMVRITSMEFPVMSRASGQARPGAHRVGANYSVTSCDLRILMDQPTEAISPHDPPSRHDHS